MSLLDRYRYRGRHRGEYPYEVWVPRDLGGVHRGRYVEKPEWQPSRRDALGPYSFLEFFVGPEVPEVPPYAPQWTISIPRGSLGPPEPEILDEARVRDIVRDELASTPVYTALRFEDYGRFGEFGDSTFDMAEPASLCIDVEVWDGRSVSCIECEQIMLERDSVWGFCSGCVELLDLES